MNRYFVSGWLILFLNLIVSLTLRPAFATDQEVRVDEKTRNVLNIFEQISAIPRCSKHEKKIAKWLKTWAKERGFEVRTDRVQNVFIKVPATKGYENAPGIVLQGHMDMVCEKTLDSDHDFSKDSLRLVYDGEWLTANKTTLGADDGIGIALALALAEDRAVSHPPLELLFTVNEEAGFTGVFAVEKGLFEGKVFLNLDMLEEGAFTVGSAGLNATVIELPISMKSLPKSSQACRLRAHGMRGGHSGVDIHKHRANAIKILARALNKANQSCRIRLVSIKGGAAANAIPRNAEALVALEPTELTIVQTVISEFEKEVQEEYAATEKSLAVTLSGLDPKTKVKSALTASDTDSAIKLLLGLPHGVKEMSSQVEGFVETSNNIATVETSKKSLHVVSLERGATMSKLQRITSDVKTIAVGAGAQAMPGGSVPAWEPRMGSPLARRCKEVYNGLFGTEPVVSTVHGSLECSVIGQKYPDIDMIALGPTVVNLHSPDEKLHIPSVGKVWRFLVALLESYKP